VLPVSVVVLLTLRIFKPSPLIEVNKNLELFVNRISVTAR